jgi:hypothetical protein
VCGVDNLTEALLAKVKANLILQHDEDDELLCSIIRAALDYAKEYQHRRRFGERLPASTEQAVIILSSHLYESRDGSTGGFFADSTNAAQQVWATVNRLLSMHKIWRV